MATTESAKLHCDSCLNGRHQACRIYTPSPVQVGEFTLWEGGGGRCVCKCRNRTNTRLTNVERKCEAIRKRSPRKPRPKNPNYKPGIYGDRKEWTDDRIRELVALKAQGLTSRQIGALTSDDMATVRTYLAVARKKGITA